MKLSELEKSTLKLLLHWNMQYLVRDEFGEIVAFQHKPELHIAKDKSFKYWAPAVDGGKCAILPPDMFNNIGYHETEPYKIGEGGTLALCNPTKKAVAV